MMILRPSAITISDVIWKFVRLSSSRGSVAVFPESPRNGYIIYSQLKKVVTVKKCGNSRYVGQILQ
jgi:hypothetical protein